jgi:CheY-like chemotaxis protein
VLVADDNEFNLFTLKQVLLGYDIESDGAYNGQVALEMAEKSLKCCPYKIIFMDCNMPIMDGFEATGEINNLFAKFKANNPNYPIDVTLIPIVALTANDTAEDRQKCLDAGMTSFMSKPPDSKELKK